MANKRFGEPVGNWSPPERPGPDRIEGRYVRLERFAPDHHADDIHRANKADDAIWDYLPYGPFDDLAGYRAWADPASAGTDPLFYAIIDKASGRAAGVASFLRIDPKAGSIEVGHINLSPALQKSRASTEAIYLFIRWAFEAGYRRFEWKCDALNLPSRRAAERYGLSYEGVFRQATVVKGRNRDTAWFAAIDQEWPAIRAAFEAWLAPENFDAAGRQRQSLAGLTRPILVTRDPAAAD